MIVFEIHDNSSRCSGALDRQSYCVEIAAGQVEEIAVSCRASNLHGFECLLLARQPDARDLGRDGRIRNSGAGGGVEYGGTK